MESVIGQKVPDLRPFTKYIWWKSADEAMESSHQLIAQVMSLGTFEDVQVLSSVLGKEVLAFTLRNAEAGEFRPCSWAYWHWVLNGLHGETLPPLPRRSFA